MPKYQQFFYDLLNLQQSVSLSKDIVKEVIGDSVNNHRTLSVNQVIRYAKANQVRNGKRVAKQIRNVYYILKPLIKHDRTNGGTGRYRTDAIDFNELVSTYRAVVMNDRELRSVIGRAV